MSPAADACGPNGMPSLTPTWWALASAHGTRVDISDMLGCRVRLSQRPTLWATTVVPVNVGDVGITVKVEFHDGLWFMAVRFRWAFVWLRPYHVVPLPGEHWAGEDL